MLKRGGGGLSVAYTGESEITPLNAAHVIAKTYKVFERNRTLATYLWNYYKGDQPVLYREKKVRDDITNRVVENHAYELVQFKNGQTYGEPVQYVSRQKSDAVSRNVDKLNDLMDCAGKPLKDINSGEWTSAVGTGFKAVQYSPSGDRAFRIVVPTPLNCYIIYNSSTEEPILAVQVITDPYGRSYFQAFSETHSIRVANGVVEEFKPHLFGGIPIVEYPNNQNRIGDIELAIDLFDSINNLQSNRLDAVEQFVQAWVKFVNCEVDEEQFMKMKMFGALVVKSNNGDGNKADVDVMSQELGQDQAEIFKGDLLDAIYSIEGIPNREGNTGGDTQGAVELRNGWDFSKQRARLKDAYVIDGDKRLSRLAIACQNLRADLNDPVELNDRDYTAQVSHSPTDNMYIKAETLQMLLNSNIHPQVAIKTSGLWADSEKVYSMSKEAMEKKDDGEGVVSAVPVDEGRKGVPGKANKKSEAGNPGDI